MTRSTRFTCFCTAQTSIFQRNFVNKFGVFNVINAKQFACFRNSSHIPLILNEFNDSSGLQCGCRNALSLHCSILLYIVEDSIFSIFLLRTFPPVSFIIFSFDEHSSGLEVLQAKSAALLRTKFCAWVGDSCSYYPRLKAVFWIISKLRFNLMQSGL